jgi:hypothetical protein
MHSTHELVVSSQTGVDPPHCPPQGGAPPLPLELTVAVLVAAVEPVELEEVLAMPPPPLVDVSPPPPTVAAVVEAPPAPVDADVVAVDEAADELPAALPVDDPESTAASGQSGNETAQAPKHVAASVVARTVPFCRI